MLFIIIAAAFLLVGLGVMFAFLFSSSIPSFGGQVGLVLLEGEISSSSSFDGSDSVYSVISLLDEADKDPSVKAVVLEINSGGGSVVASKQLVEKIRMMDKPVVAWISEVGASGAYYAASAADYAMADEDSITGSIGVISILPNFSGLLEKVGVEFQVVKEGANKDFASPFRQLTDDERAILQSMLAETYKHFRGDILDFRQGKLDVKRFNEIADGRILSGTQAKEIGLIDGLGSRNDAINEAGRIVGISGKPNVKEFSPKPETLLDVLSQAGFSFGKGFQLGLFSVSRGLELKARLQ